MLLRAIVAREVRRAFAALDRGEHGALVARTAPHVRHSFPGRHALRGTRRGPAEVELSFERLERLFPEHRFDVHSVAVLGVPSRMRVAVRWTARLRPAAGEAYENEGTHGLAFRGARLTELHAMLDSQRVAEACAAMAGAGVPEAQAPPIGQP